MPTYATSVGDLTFNSGLAFALTPDVVFTAESAAGSGRRTSTTSGPSASPAWGSRSRPTKGSALGRPWRRCRAASRRRPARSGRWVLSSRNGCSTSRPGQVALAPPERDRCRLRLGNQGPDRTPHRHPGARSDRRDDWRADHHPAGFASGAVYTSLSSSPVFVRTNAGEVRLTGAEGSIGVRLGPTLALNGNVSWVRGVDLATGLPPGLENGIPPTHGFARPSGGSRGTPLLARGVLPFCRRAAALLGQRLRAGADRRQPHAAGDHELLQQRRGGARPRCRGILVATGEKLPQVLTRVLGPRHHGPGAVQDGDAWLRDAEFQGRRPSVALVRGDGAL